MSIKKLLSKQFKTLSLLSIIILSVGCSSSDDTQSDQSKINIVSTTTMLHDLVNVIGSDSVDSIGLMEVGIDPHLYKASAGDITKLENADVVLYNGYHLEGEMGEILSSLESQGKDVLCLENALDESKLLDDEDYEYDPHVWFDVSLWIDAACYVSESLQEIDPENKDIYESNLLDYLIELNELNEYIISRIEEVDEEQRVLITAHDAFNYFGNAYDFEVMGLQGISTDSEASTLDIINLSDFIVENEIKAIFVESSVSSRSIEALQEAVLSKGFEIEIGGELYSDSLGSSSDGHNTYIETVKSNIDTIVDALK